MEEMEVVIDTEEIAEFMYDQLIKAGYVPKEAEVRVIADIVFDYLVYKKIITEQEEYFEDEDIEFWDNED